MDCLAGVSTSSLVVIACAKWAKFDTRLCNVIALPSLLSNWFFPSCVTRKFVWTNVQALDTRCLYGMCLHMFGKFVLRYMIIMNSYLLHLYVLELRKNWRTIVQSLMFLCDLLSMHVAYHDLNLQSPMSPIMTLGSSFLQSPLNDAIEILCPIVEDTFAFTSWITNFAHF